MKEKRIALYVDFLTWNLRELVDGIRSEPHASTWKVHAHWMPDLVCDHQYYYQQPDGAILYIRPEWMPQVQARLRCPIVNLTNHDQRPKLPSVLPDDHEIGVIGARHLLGLGVSNFAFAGDGRYYAKCRQRGFSAAIHKKHRRCAIATHEIMTDRLNAGLLSATIRWLRELPKPCGIMAATDPCALTLIRLCESTGICVPGEIFIAGVNNAPEYCELNDPELSSISLPYWHMGKAAANTLQRLMNKEVAASRCNVQRITQGIKLVKRHSTLKLGRADNAVTKALAFIRREAGIRTLSVEEVLSTVDISRFALDNTLQKMLGYSTAEAITRVRIGHLKYMLGNTKDSIKKIASNAGFKTTEAMNHYFRRHANVAPSAWRKKHAVGVRVY